MAVIIQMFCVLCLPLQGSLDNMSIIIICFPGAPHVSQEALHQEAELEQHIDMKVEGVVKYFNHQHMISFSKSSLK